METDEKFILVPGGEVYAKRWTPTAVISETPMVMLHDSLGCVDAWREFPAQLAESTGRIVWAYDRLGFGRSSPRAEVPSLRFIEEEAELYLPPILLGMGIEEFSVFGYSVGGEMAAMIAEAMPGACQSLVIMSAQASVEEQTIAGIHMAQKRFANPDQMRRLERWHGDKAAWTLRAWWEVWLSPDFASWSLAPHLPGVRCPVLVIHGDRDDFSSLAVPEMIATLTAGPCEVHILQGCGHVPQRDRLEDVLTLTAAFLGKCSPTCSSGSD